MAFSPVWLQAQFVYTAPCIHSTLMCLRQPLSFAYSYSKSHQEQVTLHWNTISWTFIFPVQSIQSLWCKLPTDIPPYWYYEWCPKKNSESTSVVVPLSPENWFPITIFEMHISFQRPTYDSFLHDVLYASAICFHSFTQNILLVFL